MSLKENIEMVKEELSSEEKFFENAVKTERFVKKYKKAIIGAIAGVVVVVAAGSLYDANRNSTLAAANAAFGALQRNGNDAAAKEQLKSLSPALYDAWALSKAIASADAAQLESLSSSKAVAVSDLAAYELAALKGDANLLEKYARGQNAIYRDLALVESAVLLMEQGEIGSAREKLGMIAPESSMYKVSRILLHYGVK